MGIEDDKVVAGDPIGVNASRMTERKPRMTEVESGMTECKSRMTEKMVILERNEVER